MSNLEKDLANAEKYLAHAEADMKDARTHSACVHSMNRVAHWRGVIKSLTMKIDEEN